MIQILIGCILFMAGFTFCLIAYVSGERRRLMSRIKLGFDNSSGHLIQAFTQCNTQRYYRKWHNRLRDSLQYGHSKHVCGRSVKFGVPHGGDCQCTCGATWPGISLEPKKES
jgi:hypothetical protein